MPLFLPFTFFLSGFLSNLSFFSLWFFYVFFFVFSPFFSTSSPQSICLPSLFMAIPFYTICHYGIYHFRPSIDFGFVWISLQDCPLTCRLPSHYLCSECVGCTTLYSQTKLLVLFITSLCFCFTYMDKD